jgi:outer membrane lipoprotein SlyB
VPDISKPALICLAALLPLAGCGDQYSPDTYATRAVQQANKVEQGVIVGMRQVNISAGGETGAATGAAAGGVLGAQAPGSGIVSALGGVGGALIGGLAGTAAEHQMVDTTAFEYVVRVTGKNDLVSVTQKDQRPLELGTKVLVITGNQARIVVDYTVPPEPQTAAAAPPAPAATPAGAAAPPPAPSAASAPPAEEAAAPPEPPKGESGGEAPLPTIPIPNVAAPAVQQYLHPPASAPAQNPAPAPAVSIPFPTGS